MCDTVELCFRAGCGVDASVVDNEVDVTQAKGAGIWVGCVGIFSWPQKKEEAQEEHVSNDGVAVRCVGSIVKVNGMANDLQQDGFNTVLGWILFVIGRELAMEAKVDFSRRQ